MTVLIVLSPKCRSIEIRSTEAAAAYLLLTWDYLQIVLCKSSDNEDARLCNQIPSRRSRFDNHFRCAFYILRRIEEVAL